MSAEPNYLNGLNPSQRDAVLHTEGPVMIIAGAGSGKTRVITMRVAHLLAKGVSPFNILVLTFTNKAAREMKERIVKQVGDVAKDVWMGTFHSVFARILRAEADKIGYPATFTIYDTTDAQSVVKAILKELDLDDKVYNLKYVCNRISAAKNSLISAQAYKAHSHIQAEDARTRHDRMWEIYERYENKCFRSGAMDFDDLLFKTLVLFKSHPEALYKYQNKFKYLMVDEYQDTNVCQYQIVKLLAAIQENICVVGDDAQSIYAFRGANIQNILNFQKDYSDVQVFRLEQNYRSTQTIVDAANNIIANNVDQLPKKVFSENEKGEKIKVMRAFSDNEEGKMVADSILQERGTKGLNYKDFSILYRTNAQSRAMEEALRKVGIPYKIYGGMSFYQRKENKDLLAYFRLTFNPNDEEALKRVINYPMRGIGKTTLDQIVLLSGERNMSLWEVVENFQNLTSGNRSSHAVYGFAVMIKSFAVVVQQQNAYDAAMHIAQQTGILKDLFEDKSVEGVSRYENIQELLSGIKEFVEQGDVEDKSLAAFCQDIALLTNDDKDKDANADTVSLMTIHSSKGLEFNTVFIVGLEENLFPSQRSLFSKEDLEEERRLFYVATTRAQNKLSLSYATSRYHFGQMQYCEPSRFLNEIDAKFLDIDFKSAEKGSSLGQTTKISPSKDTYSSVKPKVTDRLPKAHIVSESFTPSDPSKIQEGSKVEHERFGFGKVIAMEGGMPNTKATVLFDTAGEKQLLLRFAKLMILE